MEFKKKSNINLLVNSSWDSVKTSLIMACLRHKCCLPDFTDDGDNNGAAYASIASTSQESAETEICGLFKDLAASTGDNQ